MALNVFLLLPQDDDVIFEIIQDEDSYKQFVKDVSNTLSTLPKDNSIKLFYDSNNIQTFLNACNKFNNEIYLNNVSNQIRSFISPKSDDIQANSKKSNECIYVLWNHDNLPNVEITPPQTIAEIAERILSFPKETYILLNISGHIEACRDVLLICKDAKHIPDLPKFARIPFVIDKPDLESWLATNHIVKFSLLDRNRFVGTYKIEQGQCVYLENETGYYWYLDNLHKTHYEVFDSNCTHIGEANLDGNIDTTKKVNGRTIELH